MLFKDRLPEWEWPRGSAEGAGSGKTIKKPSPQRAANCYISSLSQIANRATVCPAYDVVRIKNSLWSLQEGLFIEFRPSHHL